VEIRDRASGALLRTHARSERAGATVLPDAERPFNPSRQTELLWRLAREIGPSCLGLCQQSSLRRPAFVGGVLQTGASPAHVVGPRVGVG